MVNAPVMMTVDVFGSFSGNARLRRENAARNSLISVGPNV
jgi:hypothetical protein